MSGKDDVIDDDLFVLGRLFAVPVAGGGALIEPSVARKVLAEFTRLAEPARPALDQLPEPLSERK